MKNIEKTLKKIAELTPKKVIYPIELLKKHNMNISLDRVNLSYLIEGGEAGGYFHWLTLLAKHSDSKLIVELGNRYGTSTIALYHGLKTNQRLITLDTEHDQRYVTDLMFKDPRVKFIYGDCINLKSYLDSNESIPIDIDILFTDTIHFYEQVSSEFEVYEPLLSDEAIIIIDDIYLNDKGRFFYGTPHKKYDLSQLCHGSGFGVIHYIRPIEERNKTKEERIQIALLRSANVWERRYNNLNYHPRSMSKRIREIKTEQLKKFVKKMLGKNITNFAIKILSKLNIK